MKGHLLISISALILLTSCSVEKRHYLKGFYFSKNHSVKRKKEKLNEEVSFLKSVEQNRNNEQQTLIAERISEKLPDTEKPVSQNQKINISINTKLTDPCDTIFLKNGTKLLGKVTEILQNDIKVNECTGGETKIIILAQKEISYIHFSNGRTGKFGVDVVNPKPFVDTIPKVKAKEEKPLSMAALAGFIFSLLFYIIPILLFLVFAMFNLLFVLPYFFITLAILLWLLALIFSIIGIIQISNKKKESEYRGKALAILGLLLILIPSFLFLIIYVAFQS